MVARFSRRTRTLALLAVLVVGGAALALMAARPRSASTGTEQVVGASNSSSAAGPASAPEAPTVLVAATGSGSVHLEWQKPVEHGAPVTSHSITITPQHASNQTTPDGNTTTADFKGLTNGTTYTFTVVGHSSVGDTAPISIQSTPQGCGGLPGVVESAPAGSRGVDTENVISASAAQQLAAAGERFVVRYISSEAIEQVGDLTASEVAGIMNAGLAIMPVQHTEAAGWVPSPTLGVQSGQAAAAHAAATGFACGVNVWLELAGVASGTDAQAIIDYVDSWYGEVAAAGFVPGLLVGPSSGLSASQLASLNVEHFWQSSASVPAVSVGYEMTQSPPTDIFGLDASGDVTQSDAQGRSVIWFNP